MSDQNKQTAKPLTRAELLEALRSLKGAWDTEVAHGQADDLLIRYINDAEIAAAYEDINKWYA